MGLINVFLLVCGCFIPPAGIILMTAPILLPIITAAGFDPVWFGVIVTINMEIGLITPPVGLNLFVVNAIAPDVPTKTVLWGSVPYVLCMVLAIVILCIFPEIATWLPDYLMGPATHNDERREMNVSFFSDLLSDDLRARPRADRASRGDEHARASVADIVKLSRELISRRGEASGVALARIILDRYASLPQKDALRFPRFTSPAISAPTRRRSSTRSTATARRRRGRRRMRSTRLPSRSSQELIRRLNLAHGGTLSLVRMREDLIDLSRRFAPSVPTRRRGREPRPGLRPPVRVLVQPRLPGPAPHRLDDAGPHPREDHPLRGRARDQDWDDLRRRLEPADRRCFAFFHPALVDEPLIFVEVALTSEIPGAIAPDPGSRSATRSRSRPRRRRCSIRSPTASAGSPASPSATS